MEVGMFEVNAPGRPGMSGTLYQIWLYKNQQKRAGSKQMLSAEEPGRGLAKAAKRESKWEQREKGNED
jgi:hypothetical protein